MDENGSKSLSNVARQRSTKSSASELFVSKTPGNSSSGYANTFRVLENQIRRKQLRVTSLCSISEEDPSPLELELAARSRLSELCDTSVFKSDSSISLNKQLEKFANVSDYIYHVARARNGVSILKPKHLSSASVPSLDDCGKLSSLYYFVTIIKTSIVSASINVMVFVAKHLCTTSNIRFPHFHRCFHAFYGQHAGNAQH
jgi:hypothetical protein